MASGKMQNLAIMDMVKWMFRVIQVLETLLQHAFQSYPKSPHDFAVADDDDALVISRLTVERIKHTVYARAHLRDGFSVGGCPEKRRALLHRHAL